VVSKEQPMKTLEQIPLKPKDREAICEAARILRQRFPVRQVVLFGSKARGDDDVESDIDLLVLTEFKASAPDKGAIADALFDTQIRGAVVLSPLVVQQNEWDGALWRVLPIHKQIEREGVLV
jgi:uncharacterized protein